MRWYVSKNGETTGPVEEAQVVEWVKGGLRDCMLRDDAGGQWTPLAQSPFAPAGPVAVAAGGSEALGTLIVLAPLLATALVWGWIGSMNLFQDPAGSLFVLSMITIVGTSALIAVEASLLGMGKRPGSNGKKESGPIGWFIACAVLWALAFPWYLHKRKYFGRRSLALAGVLFAGLFLFSTVSMGTAIEQKKAAIRQSLGGLQDRLANVNLPATTQVDAPAAAPVAVREERTTLEFGKPTVKVQMGMTQVMVEAKNTTSEPFKACVITATFKKGNTILGTANGAVNDVAAGVTRTAQLLSNDDIKGYDTVKLEASTCF